MWNMCEHYVYPTSDPTGRSVKWGLRDQIENLSLHYSWATYFSEIRYQSDFVPFSQIVDGLTPLGYFGKIGVYIWETGAKTFSRDIFQILRVLALDLLPPARKNLVTQFENSANSRYSIIIIKSTWMRLVHDTMYLGLDPHVGGKDLLHVWL
jgi:hypothetical protein